MSVFALGVESKDLGIIKNQGAPNECALSVRFTLHSVHLLPFPKMEVKRNKKVYSFTVTKRLEESTADKRYLEKSW